VTQWCRGAVTTMGNLMSGRAMRSPAKPAVESSPLNVAPAASLTHSDEVATNKSQGCDPGQHEIINPPIQWPIMFHGGNVQPDTIDGANVTAVEYYKMAVEGTARLKKTDGTRAKHIKDAFNAVRLPADIEVLNKKDPVQVHATVTVLQDRVIGRFIQIYRKLEAEVSNHLLNFQPFKFNSIADRLNKLEKIKSGTITEFGNPLTASQILELPMNPKKAAHANKKKKITK
jgi:hypothetical protein